MTPRSLFVIILKILGLFMLKDILFSGLNILNNILVETGGYYKYGYLSLIPSLISFLIYVFLFIVLVFKPEAVINRMKLTHDFYEEQFSLNMDKVIVIRIALISTGLYLIVDSTPDLCKDLIAYYQTATNNIYAETINYSARGIGYSAAKIILAYIMLANSGYLANFICNRKKEGDQDAGETS